MVYFVTGGAGFIGSNFLYYLKETHPTDRIVCLDRLTYAGNFSTLLPFLSDPLFRFVKIDVADREAVFSLFLEEKPDVVVHFAAESSVDRSILDPAPVLRTNVLGTAVLLDACRAVGVSRFHQVSTDEVYGDLPLDRPDLFFTEESPLMPSGIYASSKASADMIALSYYRTYSLPVTVSRCSNNYGPFQFPEKLVPLSISRALRKEPIPVYGDGKNVRDWLFVRDHCRAIGLILEKGKEGKVYNVGARNERSNLEVVQLIVRALRQGEIEFAKDRVCHDRRYSVCPDLIEKELGFYAETSFEEGIRKTVEWYVSNQDWLRAIEDGSYRKVFEDFEERRKK